MESAYLPKSVDPERSADQGLEFAGDLDPAPLARLGELLAAQAGPISSRFGFRRDEEGRAVMVGSAEASLPLICQRCTDLFLFEARADWRRVFARSETDEQELAEKGLDVCYHGGPLDVAELIEEELILALPMAPRHPEGCEPVARPAGGIHPFAGLAELLKRETRDN